MQRVLMTLVLRLIMNDGFSYDSVNRVFRVLPGFMVKALVIAVRRQNVTTKLAQVPEQSEFTHSG